MESETSVMKDWGSHSALWSVPWECSELVPSRCPHWLPVPFPADAQDLLVQHLVPLVQGTPGFPSASSLGSSSSPSRVWLQASKQCWLQSKWDRKQGLLQSGQQWLFHRMSWYTPGQLSLPLIKRLNWAELKHANSWSFFFLILFLNASLKML